MLDQAEPTHCLVAYRHIVHVIASIHGANVDDEEADYILWERTGFPAFWPTGDPVRDCVRQVNNFFRDEYDPVFRGVASYPLQEAEEPARPVENVRSPLLS